MWNGVYLVSISRMVGAAVLGLHMAYSTCGVALGKLRKNSGSRGLLPLMALEGAVAVA